MLSLRGLLKLTHLQKETYLLSTKTLQISPFKKEYRILFLRNLTRVFFKQKCLTLSLRNPLTIPHSKKEDRVFSLRNLSPLFLTERLSLMALRYLTLNHPRRENCQISDLVLFLRKKLSWIHGGIVWHSPHFLFFFWNTFEPKVLILPLRNSTPFPLRSKICIWPLRNTTPFPFKTKMPYLGSTKPNSVSFWLKKYKKYFILPLRNPILLKDPSPPAAPSRSRCRAASPRPPSQRMSPSSRLDWEAHPSSTVASRCAPGDGDTERTGTTTNQHTDRPLHTYKPIREREHRPTTTLAKQHTDR